MQYQRTIGSLGLLLAGIGSVIGSGWLFGPLYAAQIAGPAAVISWILGGLLMMVIAFTFAELGSIFPIAGGMAQYAQYSHGPLVSFMVGWMIWISSVAVAPVETMGLLQYAANYIPGIVIEVEHSHVLTPLGIVAAALIMMFMCVLNFYGARFFSRSNIFITAIKLLTPIATVLLLFIYNFHAANFYAQTSGGFTPFGWHGILAALPLGGIIYSFIGSNTILQLAGETKNPRRSIPLALIGSVIFCIILYAFLQIAFIGAITPSSLLNGWNNLHFTGDSGPFAAMFLALGFGWFAIILYADALISPFGTGYIYTAATARVNYGLSRIGFFPRWLQKLTHRGVPFYAILVNYFVGLLLFLPFPGWQALATFIISCFIFSYIIGPIALVALRKGLPDHPRPFHLPCATAISYVAFYICNLLIFWTGWHVVSRMMIALAIGFIFFVIYSYRKKGNLLASQWRVSWWMLPYLIGLSSISYLGSFGQGTNQMTFGVDFVVIAVFSTVIFYLALLTSKIDPELKQQSLQAMQIATTT